MLTKLVNNAETVENINKMNDLSEKIKLFFKHKDED